MASRLPVSFRTPVRSVLTLITVLAMTSSGSAGYVVRSGETLSGIALRNGVSVSALAAANRISDIHYIRAGQQLQMPGSASGGTAPAAPGGATHSVLPGQTLIGISQRYGVPVARIAAANNLRSSNLIFAGTRLRIPGVASASSERVSPRAATAARNASRADIDRMLDRTARQYGFNPRFVKALAHLESGWNNTVVSSAGAVGIMQVLPDTGQFVSTYLVGRRLDLNDPQDNITAGVAFLAHLWKLTDGDPRKTLAGYYQGLASVRQNGYYPSTKQYIANVLYLRERF